MPLRTTPVVASLAPERDPDPRKGREGPLGGQREHDHSQGSSSGTMITLGALALELLAPLPGALISNSRDARRSSAWSRHTGFR